MTELSLPLSKEELVLKYGPEGLAPESLQELVMRLDADPVVFPAQRRIMGQGEPGDAMYFIADGEAEVTIKPFGAGSPFPAAMVAHLGAGDIVGEMAVLTGQPRNATVTAISDVTVYRLSRDNWIFITAFFPGLAARVKEVAEQRVRDLAARSGSG